ncbi:MAG: type II/IV secretion system protein, partial [Candidatus Omnitrophica bacterium]|nr:type II/IV secretion system protein [Candidatus Omnitrophota bacterium]
MTSLKERFDALVNNQADPRKSTWKQTPQFQANTANLTSQVVDMILSEAIVTRASDIHLEPFQEHLRVRFRIDGKLYEALAIKHSLNILITPRVRILANLPTDAANSRKAADGRFSVKIGQQEFDFRVSTFPTILGDKIVLRILNKGGGMVDLKRLGLNAKDATRLEQVIQRRSGLFIVSGPTGSGKTTTLYSLLHRLHTPEVNIVTMEDPVEYQIDGINQCDIKKKGDEDFASGLKAILRQDPNIVLIGEIRDKETAEIAIRASITGHLVLTSLHANSAIGTVVRLVNMGLESYMVSYAVIGAVAQRLAPKICEQCRTAYTASAQTIERLATQCGISPKLFFENKTSSEELGIKYSSDDEDESPSTVTLYKGTGCVVCGGTG